MNIIKNILGRIFALWAMIMWIVTMLLFWIPMWITRFWSEPKRSTYFLNVANWWLKIFFFFTGTRLTIKGRDNFEKGQNYIVICNHNSLMDPPVSSPAIPAPNKTIAKMELARIPIFGMIYKGGSVLVDRKNNNSRRESYLRMRDVLANGMHMVIYPEGTRNKTGKPLKDFHDGAFKLAVDTGKPIMPSILYGTGKAMPPDKTFYFWPTRLEMHFLDPVPVSVQDDPQRVKENMHRLMWDYYVQNNPDSN
jgi:1-acyl-sn-glycerol-3-phosphate acyltransferase